MKAREHAIQRNITKLEAAISDLEKWMRAEDVRDNIYVAYALRDAGRRMFKKAEWADEDERAWMARIRGDAA